MTQILTTKIEYASIYSLTTLSLAKSNHDLKDNNLNDFLTGFWTEVLYIFDKGLFNEVENEIFISSIKDAVYNFLETHNNSDLVKDNFIEFVEVVVGFSSDSFSNFIENI